MIWFEQWCRENLLLGHNCEANVCVGCIFAFCIEFLFFLVWNIVLASHFIGFVSSIGFVRCFKSWFVVSNCNLGNLLLMICFCWCHLFCMLFRCQFLAAHINFGNQIVSTSPPHWNNCRQRTIRINVLGLPCNSRYHCFGRIAALLFYYFGALAGVDPNEYRKTVCAAQFLTDRFHFFPHQAFDNDAIVNFNAMNNAVFLVVGSRHFICFLNSALTETIVRRNCIVCCDCYIGCIQVSCVKHSIVDARSVLRFQRSSYVSTAWPTAMVESFLISAGTTCDCRRVHGVWLLVRPSMGNRVGSRFWESELSLVLLLVCGASNWIPYAPKPYDHSIR